MSDKIQRHFLLHLVLLTEFMSMLVLAIMWNLLAGYADIVTVGQHDLCRRRRLCILRVRRAAGMESVSFNFRSPAW